MSKSIKPLVLAIALAASSGAAYATGDGGDNGMTAHYGDSWANLQARNPDAATVPSMAAQDDAADARASWAHARDRMRTSMQNMRDRTSNTFHRMTGTSSTGTASTGSPSYGTSQSGTASTGTSSYGNAPSGTASTGTSSYGTSASGSASTGTASTSAPATGSNATSTASNPAGAPGTAGTTQGMFGSGTTNDPSPSTSKPSASLIGSGNH